MPASERNMVYPNQPYNHGAMNLAKNAKNKPIQIILSKQIWIL